VRRCTVAGGGWIYPEEASYSTGEKKVVRITEKGKETIGGGTEGDGKAFKKELLLNTH